MANIFRIPLILQRFIPRQPTVWTGPDSLFEPLAQAAVYPFRQLDWPNPILPWRLLQFHTWRHPNVGDPNPYPNLQTDWPNPILRVRTIHDLTGQDYTLSTLLSVVQTTPFTPDEFPNPILRRPLVVPFALRPAAGIPPVSTPVSIPFIPMEFPNPQPKPLVQTPLGSRALKSFIEPDPATLLIEWPNPQVRMYRQPVDLMPSPLLFTLPLPNPAPFSQTDWANPVLRKGSQENLFWWNPIRQTTLATVNTKPFMQADYPNPRGPRPVQQKDFEMNGTFILQPPPPEPIKLRKTLSVVGSRVKERQVHLPGDL